MKNKTKALNSSSIYYYFFKPCVDLQVGSSIYYYFFIPCVNLQVGASMGGYQRDRDNFPLRLIIKHLSSSLVLKLSPLVLMFESYVIYNLIKRGRRRGSPCMQVVTPLLVTLPATTLHNHTLQKCKFTPLHAKT